MSFTALAKSLEIAWALLEEYGIEPAPLFKDAGIDPRSIKDLSARINQASLDKLWVNISEHIDDPCWGLKLGGLWHPSYMHALGYAWLASSTLRSALNRLVRFIHIVNQKASITLSENADSVSIDWEKPSTIMFDDWRADGALSVIMRMCRANYGENLDPVSVSFKHGKPDCAGDYFAYFRCPVSFNADRDSLVLSKESVDQLLPGSNPLMSQINDNEMIKYLAKLNTGDIIQRTKAAIIEHLPDGRASDSAIAKSLHMSSRTLQRKLNEKGTTFKKLLTEVRKELALKYIRNNQMTLTELSFQLGFSEMSAFSRAFKQWTGNSPRQYRESI